MIRSFRLIHIRTFKCIRFGGKWPRDGAKTKTVMVEGLRFCAKKWVGKT